MVKVIVDIPDEMWNTLQIGQYQMGYAEYVARYVEKGKLIPSNATNGDVIKALFPNVETHEFAITIHATTKVECNGVKGGISYDFWKEWWNAKYKEVSDGND